MKKKILARIKTVTRDGEIDVRLLRRYHEYFGKDVEDPLRVAVRRFVERGEHEKAAAVYGLLGERGMEAEYYKKAGCLKEAAQAYEKLGEIDLAADLHLENFENAANRKTVYPREDFLEALKDTGPVLGKMKDKTKIEEILQRFEKAGKHDFVVRILIELGEEKRAIAMLDDLMENGKGCYYTDHYVTLGRYDKIREMVDKICGEYDCNRIMRLVRALRDGGIAEGYEEMEKTRERLLETMGVDPAEEVKAMAGRFARICANDAERFGGGAYQTAKPDNWYYTHKQDPDSTFGQWRKQQDMNVAIANSYADRRYAMLDREKGKRIAALFLEAGEVENAIKAYGDPIPAWMYREAGMQEMEARAYEEEAAAEYDFGKALDLMYRAIEIFEKLGKKDELERIARKCLAEGKMRKFIMAGNIYQKLGMEKKAFDCFVKHGYQLCIIKRYAEEGMYEEAVQLSLAGVDDMEGYKGWHYREALKHLRKLGDKKRGGEVAEKLIEVLIDNGELEEAEELMKEFGMG